MSVNLGQSIRDAIITDSSITALLGTYAGAAAVFTRRPVPDDVSPGSYPLICVSADISITDEDGVFDFRTVILRDVVTYGMNNRPGDLRAVNQIAFLLYNLFHRQRHSITPPDDWTVVDIIANGPIQMPGEAYEQIVARGVPLRILIAKLREAGVVPPVVADHLLLTDGSDLLLTDGGLLLLAGG